MHLYIPPKARFREDFELMQTFLNQPEIQQIHYFMTGSKNSYKDLQVIFSCKTNQAKDIQKTIIFVNTISNIWLIIKEI